MLLDKIWGKIYRKFINSTVQKSRILFYALLSEIKIRGIKVQPVLAHGEGEIIIGKGVVFGVEKSTKFYSDYIYMDARNKESVICIGKDCIFNNSVSIICEGSSISIGNNCLIGGNVQMLDSDFHDLHPGHRFSPKYIHRKEIKIFNNVFIGNNVTILKGVEIGKNSVIGNHSVVVKSIPENVIAVGNPAEVVRKL